MDEQPPFFFIAQGEWKPSPRRNGCVEVESQACRLLGQFALARSIFKRAVTFQRAGKQCQQPIIVITHRTAAHIINTTTPPIREASYSWTCHHFGQRRLHKQSLQQMRADGCPNVYPLLICFPENSARDVTEKYLIMYLLLTIYTKTTAKYDCSWERVLQSWGCLERDGCGVWFCAERWIREKQAPESQFWIGLLFI